MRIPSLRSRSTLLPLALAWMLWLFGTQVLVTYAATCIDPQTTSERECRPGETDISGTRYEGPTPTQTAPTEDGSPAVTSTPTPTPATTPAAQPTNSVFPGPGSDNTSAVAPAPTVNNGALTPVPSGVPSGALTPAPSGVPSGAVTPSANNGGTGSSVQLRNPLSGISSIPDLLAAILRVITVIAIPIIILFIILAGFKYVTAKGNAKNIQDATNALLYAIIGGVIIIGATAIAQIIKNLVNAFTAT